MTAYKKPGRLMVRKLQKAGLLFVLILGLFGCGQPTTNRITCVEDSYGTKCFQFNGNTVYEWGTMTPYTTGTYYVTEFKTTLPLPVKTVLSSKTDYPTPADIRFSGDPVDTIDIFVIYHASDTTWPVDPSTQINWSIKGEL